MKVDIAEACNDVHYFSESREAQIARRARPPRTWSSIAIDIAEKLSVNPKTLAIALIFAVDRILDMIRTVVNVTGDATVATVVASSEGQLRLVSEEELMS